MTRFRQSGYREIHKEELAQVRQNLTELQDSDLRELSQFLDYYDAFWLEEKVLEEKRVAYLRGAKDGLLNVASLLPKSKIFCISATLVISNQINLSDLLGFEQATMDLLPTKKVENQEIIFPTNLPDIIKLPKVEPYLS